MVIFRGLQWQEYENMTIKPCRVADSYSLFTYPDPAVKKSSDLARLRITYFAEKYVRFSLILNC
jgi:hypothetical protein